MRMSPTNSAAQTANATTSLSTNMTGSSGNHDALAQPEKMLSRVESASDTSSKKPKAIT